MKGQIMLPRRENSKKWTPMPSELIEQIQSVFSEAFSAQSQNGQFLAEGRIYPTELLFRIGYLETGRLTQQNIEISLDFNAAKQNALQHIHLLIDCAASLMEKVFQDEENFQNMPRQWKMLRFEGHPLFFQASSENSALEAEADKLLIQETQDRLVKGDVDSFDYLDDIGSVEDSELNKPTPIKKKKSAEKNKKKPTQH